ncbi:hypothetical protein J3Q64DRAFT_1397334 [Phycomyces blakesleeanus]|uniref:Rad21/Rec8-like protein C-terminal eukaryotic domain-containing protein n=1 Tax=Phycomyces blakesleeanus TaxID=4837 RepID=A0ABR3B6D2_PHYBL
MLLLFLSFTPIIHGSILFSAFAWLVNLFFFFFSNQRYRRSNSPSFGHPSSIDIQYSPSPLDLQYEGVEYGDSFPNTLGGASAIIEEHLSRNACALAGKTYIEFEQLLYDGQNCPRSQVAHVFYQLLVLASINKLDVVQSEPYGCIKFRAQ